MQFFKFCFTLVVFVSITSRIDGAGANAGAMKPRTVAVSTRSGIEAPASRKLPTRPSTAVPIVIPGAGVTNKFQETSTPNIPHKAVNGSRKQSCPDINQCSFVEHFKKKTNRWIAAHGYANGNPFDAWWSSNKAVIDLGKGEARLTVSKGGKFGKNFVAGQLQTTKWYGYGCYEVRMKPIKQEGLISTFFTYTGKWDLHPGATPRHNEVDIEFVWKKWAGKLLMQANYFTNGQGGNEHYIQLPFAPEKAFHNYAFRWQPNKIEWFVDGSKVYTAWHNTPKAKYGNHKIMMNFWPVQKKAAGWGGFFKYKGPRTVVYKAIRFTRGANCKIVNKF